MPAGGELLSPPGSVSRLAMGRCSRPGTRKLGSLCSRLVPGGWVSPVVLQLCSAHSSPGADKLPEHWAPAIPGQHPERGCSYTGYSECLLATDSCLVMRKSKPWLFLFFISISIENWLWTMNSTLMKKIEMIKTMSGHIIFVVNNCRSGSKEKRAWTGW